MDEWSHVNKIVKCLYQNTLAKLLLKSRMNKPEICSIMILNKLHNLI